MTRVRVRTDRAIQATGMSDYSARNGLNITGRPYRWRGIPGWRPEDAQPQPGRPVDRAEHGTTGGYKRHRAAGEPACQDCKNAEADYRRQWEIRRKARQP